MNSFFANFHWEPILKNKTIEEAYCNFLCILHFAVSLFVPLKSSETNNNYPPHIKKLFIHRDLLLNSSDPTPASSINQVNKSIKRETDKFFRYKERKLIKKGSKAIFNYIAKFTKPKNISIPTLSEPNGELIFDSSNKSEAFATYFNSVFTPSVSLPLLSPSQNNFSVSYSSVTIYNLLKNLKASTGISPDRIPSIIFKLCSESLARPITMLINLSLFSGTLPSFWKQSIVIPLLKKGDKHQVSNYRPISLSSPLCKITERLIYDHLYNFLDQNNLIPACQHGFLKRKSVTTQLLETFDCITDYVDRGNPVDIIYFDFRKAFDKVPHDKLLAKLRRANIPNWIFAWIKAFLSDRSFKVKIDNSFSSPKTAPSGVPQGSVLGPLLFLFFIADLPISCHTLKVIIKLFADDLKIFCADLSPFGPLHEFLIKLHLWCLENGLEIAPEKCTVLHVLPRLNPKIPYYFNGNRIPVATSAVRDLGVMIDSNLSWAAHIQHVCSKANSRRYLLFKSLKSLDPHFLSHMFCVYVRPIIDFASPVFNPCKKKLIIKLEQVQKSATKIIFLRCPSLHSQANLSYPERLKILNLPSIEERLRILDLNTFHSIFNKTINAELSYTTLPSNTRGSKFNINIPIANLKPRSSFFTIRAGSQYVKILKEKGIYNPSF